MRIVAGRWGGRRLTSPRGAATRPTADRVREALFSILGPRVEGARVLDLFAGSGALGLEALSRGADEATFVDSAPAAIAAVRANLGALGGPAEGRRAVALGVLRAAPGGVSPAGRGGRPSIRTPAYRPRHPAWRRASGASFRRRCPPCWRMAR